MQALNPTVLVSYPLFQFVLKCRRGTEAERFCLSYVAQKCSVGFVQWSIKSAQKCIQTAVLSLPNAETNCSYALCQKWTQCVRGRCRWNCVRICCKSSITYGLPTDDLRPIFTVRWNHNCVLPLHCVLGPFEDSCTHLSKSIYSVKT